VADRTPAGLITGGASSIAAALLDGGGSHPQYVTISRQEGGHLACHLRVSRDTSPDSGETPDSAGETPTLPETIQVVGRDRLFPPIA
jgi:hypothetical protein